MDTEISHMHTHTLKITHTEELTSSMLTGSKKNKNTQAEERRGDAAKEERVDVAMDAVRRPARNNFTALTHSWTRLSCFF